MFVVQTQFPFNLNEEQVFGIAEGLYDMVQAHTARRIDHDDNKPWHVEWYCEEEPTPSDITARLAIKASVMELSDFSFDGLTIGEVKEQNWLEQVYEELKPFSVGPLYIYGSHFDGAVPEGQMGIQMDAATAFGSGDHGTTKGCLQAMLDLKGKGICPWNVLDMGTGSGILSIAAWKLWQTPITAVDVDEESVRVAAKYRDINAVKDGKSGMICEHGDGFQTSIVQERKPYDLIIANILAGPVIEMASDLCAVCDDLGYVILSGMLKTQADDVRAAYEKQGLKFKNRYDLDKWSSLVLQKP